MAILDLMGIVFSFHAHTYIFSISPAWPGPAGAEKKKKKKTEREKEFYSHKVCTYRFSRIFNQVGDGNRNFVVLKQYKSQARPQIKNIEIFIFNL